MATPVTKHAEDVRKDTLPAMLRLVTSVYGFNSFRYTVEDEKQYVLLLGDKLNTLHEFIRMEPLTGDITQDSIALTSWFEAVMYKVYTEKGGL